MNRSVANPQGKGAATRGGGSWRLEHRLRRGKQLAPSQTPHSPPQPDLLALPACPSCAVQPSAPAPQLLQVTLCMVLCGGLQIPMGRPSPHESTVCLCPLIPPPRPGHPTAHGAAILQARHAQLPPSSARGLVCMHYMASLPLSRALERSLSLNPTAVLALSTSTSCARGLGPGLGTAAGASLLHGPRRPPSGTRRALMPCGTEA